MSSLTNTLNLALDLPSDLINIISSYIQQKEFKKILEFKHHDNQIIEQGHIIMDATNDTATLEKTQILHKTLLSYIGAYIYIYWSSNMLNVQKIQSYTRIMDAYKFPLYPYSENRKLKDICLTKEIECFLTTVDDKYYMHLHQKNEPLDSIYMTPIELHSQYDHLFVIPNQTPEIIVVLREETPLNSAEIKLFGVARSIFKTPLKVIKKHIIYVLDTGDSIEKDFYFFESDNVMTYVGSKTYLVTKTKKYNAIFIQKITKRHLCVLRETHLEIYEEFLPYD